MIPVAQTSDNCMAACWASILEIPLEAVPDYQLIRRAGGAWLNAVNIWLSKHWRLVYVETERHVTPHVQPVGWHLINVGVPERGDGGHAIVGWRGTPVWDPRGRPVLRPVRADTYGLLVGLTDDLERTWRPLWGTCLCPYCLQEGP